MLKELLKPEQLYDYQKECVWHQLNHPDSMLWLQMGLGKTIVTLTTIIERMRAGLVKKTLIFGPLRVIQAVWAREARKWEHTKRLRFSVIHGTREKRERALFADADIYLINYEAMNWLAQQLDHYYISQDKPLPFEMVVYDEVSKLKNSTTLRIAGGNRDRKDKKGNEYKIKVTGWRKMINLFKFRTGLTGTPASNGYLDLHGQFLAVDGGQRLGEYVTHYKDNYFMSDYNGWKYTPTELGKQWIEKKVSDITIKMDTKDYLDLPESKTINLMVDLPPVARKAYDEVEKDMFTLLDSGKEIEVFSRSSVSNKCLQFANGSPYLSPESKEFEKLHDAKLDALESVLEEAAGSPVLCSYSFKADAERIMKKFKKYAPVNLTAEPSKNTEKIIDRWNQGRIKLLIGHPLSMGHGVDGLQDGGSIIVWFGVNWSLELYDQMNGRLDRNGQKHSVSIIRILCRDTVDLAVVDAIERKTDDQEGLKSALQRYRKGFIDNALEVNFF
jgi:SNF2 family DNA or RNA helicase